MHDVKQEGVTMNKEERYELYRFSVGPGWWGILDRYVPQLRALDPKCDLYIKEKYGMLRLYVTCETIDGKVREETRDAAELESVTVCECCGVPGRLREELVWIMTLCDRCLAADPKQRDRIEAEAEQRWLKSAPEDV